MPRLFFPGDPFLLEVLFGAVFLAVCLVGKVFFFAVERAPRVLEPAAEYRVPVLPSVPVDCSSCLPLVLAGAGFFFFVLVAAFILLTSGTTFDGEGKCAFLMI